MSSRTERPIDAGDDADADRARQAEWTTQGVGLAALAHAVRVTEGGRHDLRGRLRRAEDSDVDLWLAAHDLRVGSRPVRERQPDIGRVGHDMPAREDVAGLAHDDAAADPLVPRGRATRLWPVGLHEDKRWAHCLIHELRERRRGCDRCEGLADARIDVLLGQARSREQDAIGHDREKARRVRRTRTAPTARDGPAVAAAPALASGTPRSSPQPAVVEIAVW